MSEVKRFVVDMQGRGEECVLASDYDAIAAECERLRESHNDASHYAARCEEMRAECERLRLDNLSKNGSMKAFGEQIAALQRAVKNRDKLKARAEKERDAALAELAALQGGREAVGKVRTVGGHPDDSEHKVEWLCKFRDLRDGELLYTAPPAQASAWVPEVKITGHLDEVDAPVWEFINAEARKLGPLTGSIDSYGLSRPNGAQPNGGVVVLWNGQKIHAVALVVRDAMNRTQCVRMLAAASTPGASDGKANEP